MQSEAPMLAISDEAVVHVILDRKEPTKPEPQNPNFNHEKSFFPQLPSG
jgi:hypothetical protein